MASNSIPFASSFVKTGSLFQKLKRGTYTQHGELMSLLLFRKEGKYAKNKY
jgi:hypothetical protein